MKKILITGGAGFVGAHFVEHVLKNTDWQIVSLDRLDFSGNLNRMTDFMTPEYKRRVNVVFWDLKAELNELVSKQLGGPFDYIAHLAAGSHVDRSIIDPMSFFMDNCIGTVNLLNYARNGGLKKAWSNFEDGKVVPEKIEGRFLYFSTDEVYGPAPFDDTFKGFKEWARLNPNNPYAAAKAAAEMAVISFANTYRVPCVMTNTMNIFGERQHPEKFIPLVIRKCLSGEEILIHANKDLDQAGMRHYLHARNVGAAALHVLINGKTLDGSATVGRYNIVGDKEVDNMQMARLIHSIVKAEKPDVPDLNARLVDFHSSRPGHDLRYALDGELLASEGFSYAVDFEESLAKTIRWTLQHPEWL